jgi:phosphopantetheinyl transferase
VDARGLYDERWMFHGPAYQGVIELGPISADGIRGRLETLPAPGALLDAAGQLMGYWILVSLERDRLILPTGVERIQFFGAEPPVGSQLECTVRIRRVRDQDVRAELEIIADGRTWALLEGWTDMRFVSDEVVTDAARAPETITLADPGERPFTLVRERWSNAAFRELMMRRYLAEEERSEYEGRNPNAQRQWLLGRMAAKDAARTWLWQHGHGSMFPIEVRVSNDDSGQPRVSGAFGEDLRVSVAHKDSVAVALVAEDRDVGIDVEKIETRSERFAELALTDSERLLCPREDRDVWITRMWTAKEAVAKSMGTGLKGRPRDFVISRIDGERMLIDETWVESCREGDYVVSWTT